MKNTAGKTVVQLIDNPSPQTAGLVNGLAGRGWQVHVIYRQLALDVRFDVGVTLHRLPVSVRYPLTYVAFLAAAPIILSIKPDLIHAHYLTGFGILAAVYRRFLRFKPMVLSVYGNDVAVDAASGMTRWSAEHALKMFEAITCPDDATAAALRGLEAPAHRIKRLDWSAGSGEDLEAAVDRLDRIYPGLILSKARKEAEG